jgi:hypothetical protein
MLALYPQASPSRVPDHVPSGRCSAINKFLNKLLQLPATTIDKKWRISNQRTSHEIATKPSACYVKDCRFTEKHSHNMTSADASKTGSVGWSGW